jgi:hypothetical protein
MTSPVAEMPTVVYTNPTSVPVAFVGKKNLVVVEVLFPTRRRGGLFIFLAPESQRAIKPWTK